MRSLKQLVLLLTVTLCSTPIQQVNAQDALNKWGINLGLNAITNPIRVGSLLENVADADFTEDFSTTNFDPAGFKLDITRYIAAKFSFGISTSVNNITLNNDPSDEELPYASVNGRFKYVIGNGLIFKPYILLGGGYTWVDDIGAGTANGGIGFDIFFSNNFGINIEGVYRQAFLDRGIHHSQYSAGLIYKFGARDKDKDGIKDDDDECPEEFGLLKFNGCPDTDQDGVPDSKDECPKIPGLESLNGCPDSDGDGVSDFKDECPQVAGAINLKGCPDTDGDGIPDKFDRCPQNPGSNNNGGCPIPDTDKDGVNDANDKCPRQPGSASNAGCPISKPVAPAPAPKVVAFRTITFEYAKIVLSANNKMLLDEIANAINAKPGKIFHIAGHADNTFTDEHNLKLSRNRADIVKNYLVEKGVDEARLTIKGYGETRPLDPNDLESEEARAKNRRVEIFEIN